MRRLLHGKYFEIGKHQTEFKGKLAIEIGGPSEIFGDEGSLPVYSLLRNVDNCLFSNSTIWSESVQNGGIYRYQRGRESGTQFVCEGASLESIPTSSYDVILSSHCLEHMANPLGALEGWKRVLKTGGCILLILPHKDGTFDWKRPVTPLAHMIQDYEQNIGEDDLTHLPEIIALHDMIRDKAALSKEAFVQRCLNNSRIRGMHHHVFSTPVAVEMMDRAGFQLLEVGAFRPHDIVLLAIKPTQPPDNFKYLSSEFGPIKRSPFQSDHVERSLEPVLH
jgi:SAM-dependent methyltransferase